MPDFQRIVDDLRNAVLYAAGTPSTEAIEKALADYGDACERTNERLRHCETLLKKGLRSEAIQYAEIDPSLVDVVAMLDFPEREVLGQTLRQLGFRLPNLYSELAADLNEAYAAQQPLDALLGRHRFLALAAAPLKERLQVLRRIADADSSNPIWNEDVAAYEQERFKELHAVANRASRFRDLATLETCCQEITQTSWQQLPPETFKRALLKARDETRRLKAHERLQTLEKDLNLAHGALDVAQGRLLRDQWHQFVAVAQPADDDPLQQRVSPALDWLAEQDRRDAENAAFTSACAELECALDRETIDTADRVRLESLYHAATNLPFELPIHLEERYRSRIAGWELMTTRKTRLRLVTIVAVLILVGGGIAFGINVQMRNNQVRAATKALEELVVAGRADPDSLPAADKYLANLKTSNPELAESPGIQQLAGEVAVLIQKEKDRDARFQSAMATASAAGPKAPNRNALNEATELARTDAEKALIARFQSSVSLAARELQVQRDADLTAEVSRLSDRLKAVEDIGFADLDRLYTALSELRTEADSVKVRHPEATAAAVAQVTPLQARIAALRATADRLAAERTSLQYVIDGVTSRSRYLDALNNYVTAHPTGVRSADFKLALTEAAQWTAIDDWNQAVVKAKGFVDQSATPNDISFLKTAATTFQRFPQADMFSARAARCEQLAARKDASGLPRITKLRTLFDNQLMKDAWIIKTKEGGLYYSLQEEQRASGVSQKLNIVVDYALTIKSIIVPSDSVITITKAPQCAMSTAVLAELDRLKTNADTEWEAGFAKIIRTIYASSEVEPLLRLGLLKKVVETATQGSQAIKDELRVETGLFENTEANLLVNWMDAKSEDAKLAAQTARKELLVMMDLPANADRAVLTAKLVPTTWPSLPVYRFMGCLLNEDGVAWRCAGDALSGLADGSLVVMLPNLAEGAVVREVGKLVKGAVSFHTSEKEGFVQGRLVWVTTTP